MQHGSQGSCRQHWPGLLLVHLFHPFLLLPAGLGLIKTMCKDSYSHFEGDCLLLLPDCCDWLHYRIVLENCFFYESTAYSIESEPFGLEGTSKDPIVQPLLFLCL